MWEIPGFWHVSEFWLYNVAKTNTIEIDIYEFCMTN